MVNLSHEQNEEMGKYTNRKIYNKILIARKLQGNHILQLNKRRKVSREKNPFLKCESWKNDIQRE